MHLEDSIMRDFVSMALTDMFCMLLVVAMIVSVASGVYSTASLVVSVLTLGLRKLPGAPQKAAAVVGGFVAGVLRSMPGALRDWLDDQGFTKPVPKPTLSELERAYAVLGFDPAEALTREALTARARAMRSKVHPDKGFPNHVFVQMVNDAVNTIKNAKRWR
jgi:hypothetical protein